MTDSLERAKAIADLEFQKPQSEKLETILQKYDRGETSYDEFVSKTVKEAKTSEKEKELHMKDNDKMLDNIAAMREIASGTKETPEVRAILKDFRDGKITGAEADRRLLKLREKGK